MEEYTVKKYMMYTITHSATGQSNIVGTFAVDGRVAEF